MIYKDCTPTRVILMVIKGSLGRYLKGCPGKGINVIRTSNPGVVLKAYIDADWARCTDTRRALTFVTSEVIWVLKILNDLDCNNMLPVKVFFEINDYCQFESAGVCGRLEDNLDKHAKRDPSLNGSKEEVEKRNITHLKRAFHISGSNVALRKLLISRFNIGSCKRRKRDGRNIHKPATGEIQSMRGGTSESLTQ
ncbi:hypothetical protein Tco_0443470 [Tanacetum coccineum]